jgi:hypothetical protein
MVGALSMATSRTATIRFAAHEIGNLISAAAYCGRISAVFELGNFRQLYVISPNVDAVSSPRRRSKV